MRRRTFLGAGTVSLASWPWTLGCSASETAAPPGLNVEVDADLFPQSVASGDPRPNSVVLWTRIQDGSEGSRRLWLQVSPDSDFSRVLTLDDATALELSASAEHDHCIKVSVVSLEPSTEYYYRFLYDPADPEGKSAGELGTRQLKSSRTGRTKTAPAADSTRACRFGVVACQDSVGRYFHCLRVAAAEDWDFFLHLGDYIYETLGDPRFQAAGAERTPEFRSPLDALELPLTTPSQAAPRPEDAGAPLPPSDAGGAGDAGGEQAHFLAANSLENYRDLYRAVRSDRNLQRLHEQVPMIAIPDDHEFSDDCSGDAATYSNGLLDERSQTRRLNADRAWWEYMPVQPGAAKFSSTSAFPDNLRLYRDFVFGKHLHVVMTDLRRYRPGHVIPESAPPGQVAVTQAELLDLYDALPASAEPYVNLDTYNTGRTRERLAAALEDGLVLPFFSAELTGNYDAATLNEMLQIYNERYPAEPEPLVDLTDPTLERGFAFRSAGKTQPYSSVGSRQFVIDEPFVAIAANRYRATDGASEDVLGKAQEDWFVETLKSSEATWKVWGNSYTLMQRLVDLSGFSAVDPELQQRFRIFADDWDGFPNRRAVLLAKLRDVQNLVAVTGDLHAFLAGDLGVADGERIFEFVSGAISSATYQALLESPPPGYERLAQLGALAGLLLQLSNPSLAYQNLNSNGFASVQVSAQRFDVEFVQLAHPGVLQATLDGDFNSHFTRQRFRLERTGDTLLREVDETWKVWDRNKRAFV